MHHATRRSQQISALAALIALALSVGWTMTGGAQAPAGVTAFEGARVIVGDDRPAIDNATIVVNGGRIEQMGPASGVKVPAGAARVSLAGKTVMPTIIDTHTHLGLTRDDLTRDLKQRAYFGVSAALSMGLDKGDVPFQIRAQVLSLIHI